MITAHEEEKTKERVDGTFLGPALTSNSVRRASLLGLILLGAYLRLDGLFSSGLHSDEALYASWARLIAVWRDPLLAGQVVDKPPLLFYLQALFYPLTGTPAPWVARLPSMGASVLLIPMTARLVWQIYGDRLAMTGAAIVMALSPLAIRFSPTAFTDPLLTFFLVAALVVATIRIRLKRDESRDLRQRNRNLGLWTGVLYGLAVASKHQALLFLPLYLGVVELTGWNRRRRWAAIAGFTAIVFILLVWSFLRTESPAPWLQQVSAYGGVRLAWSWELWPRLEAWGSLWADLLGSPLVAFALTLGLPLFLALLIQRQDWDTAWDQLILLFIIAYGLLHWFVAVPVWARYLLPLVPLTAVLLGRFISRLLNFSDPAIPFMQRWLPSVTLGLLLLFLLLGAFQGRRTGLEVESGASSVATWLAEQPANTVLYDHWYSWQWRYFLFDTAVYVSWFPHPQALVEDLRAFGDRGQRFIVLPRSVVADPVSRAIRHTGFALRPVHAAGEMTLYRIVPGRSP